MKSLLAPLLRSLGLAALSLLLASQAQAAVSVTGADVTATSSEAVAGTYKTIITGPVLTEAAIGEVKTTTAFTLNAPTGWEFDTTGTPPTATVTKAPTGANTANLATVTLGTRAASTITWSVVQSSGNSESIITFGNIRVKSSSGAANGSMTFSSTPGVTGLTAGSTSLGNFTTTAGAATKLLFGQQPSTVAYGAAISPAVTVRVTDANGFTVTSDTSQITIGSANASLSGTLTANAVAGVATFSNLIPNLAGIGKTLTASHATLTGATSSSFKVSMSLTAATPSWRTLLQGSTYDYINDQQATAVDLELVGNATHPVLYSYYDNNGTDTDTDDTLYLRVSLSGSKSGTAPSTFSSGYLFLGAEVNGDNAMDFFLSITQRTAREQRISVWGVGTGLNVSPNTTSIAAEIPVVDLVTNPTNSNFALVTATNDPSVTDVNLNDATLGTTALALGINDHFLSFKLPFNNTTAAVDSLKEAAAAKGVALTKDSPLRLLLGTSTQSNSLNSDLNGYQGGTKSTTTFASQGAFSSTLSFSNTFPAITSNGAGSTAQVIVSSGTTVTTVTATDADSDPLSYSISGGANSASFSINATTGLLTFLSTPAAGTYVVTVKVNDLVSVAGANKDALSFDTQTLTITVPDGGDVTPPTVLSVTSSKTDAHYKAGELIPIEVTFSEPLVVTGTPQLTLETGTTDRAVDYSSGTGSAVLTFNYTVQAGDTSPDLDYLGAAALTLNGGTIKDANNNSATLTLPLPGATGSLGANKALVIDTTAPTYVSGTANGATVVLSLADTNNLDAVSPPATSAFTATINAVSATVTKVVVNDSAKTATLTLGTASGSGQTVVITYTDPSASDDGYALQDLAGNDKTTFTSENIAATGDVTPPTVLGVSAYDIVDSTPVYVNGHYGSTIVIPLRVEFSEPVTVTGTPTLTVETGATDRTVSYTSGSGTSVLLFNYTIQAGDTSPDLDYTTTAALALGGGTIKDASANNATLTLAAPAATNSLGANNDLVIDTTAPVFASATVTGSTLTLTYTETNSLDSTLPPTTGTFAVTVATVSRSVTAVSINSAAKQVVLTLASAVTSGQAVTVAYTDPTGSNDVNATQDLAGNDAVTLSATSVTNTSGDATAPTLTSIANNTVGNSALTQQAITYTFTFNEDIDATTFSAVDLINAGTSEITIGTITETSPGVFTVIITPSTTGTIQLRIRSGAIVLDTAGNALVTTSELSGGGATVNVTKLPQTITFGSLASKTFGDAPFSISATASSSLTVSFAVTSGPATLSGTNLTLTGVGTVTIRASQAGNTTYDAAPNVDQSFNVSAVSGTPEMNVRGGTVSIRNGTVTYSTSDNTDFGIAKAPAGSPITKTFTIENVGTGTLLLSGTPVVALSGANSADFTVVQPTVTAINGSGSATFSIIYQPAAVINPSTASISITNSDANESPYTFAIKGRGNSTLGPVDLTMTGGRIPHDTAVPLASGTFTATPDLGAANTFTLVTAPVGDPTADDDNDKFQITGNALSLITGATSSKTNIAVKSSYNIYVQVADNQTPTPAVYAKAFQVLVMNIVSDTGDFLVADRGPYNSTGTILLISKAGYVLRTYETTIKDPYEITTDANGDFIVANYEHDLTSFTVKTDGGVYKLNRQTGVKTKIAGGSPFITPLGVRVESSGKYLVADADYFSGGKYGAIFRIDPTITPNFVTNPPTTDNKTILSKEGNFDYIQGLALAPNGDIYVSNIKYTSNVRSSAQILKVDPTTGAQTLVATLALPSFPTGLAVEADGNSLVVADAIGAKVISINLVAGGSYGAQTVYSSGSPLVNPTHIAIEADGNYLVTDGLSNAITRRLFRVDKGTGVATQLYIDGSFDQPRGVTLAK